jgi:hypothetical protein
MRSLYHARVILIVWDVEYTDEFEQWWDTLSMNEQAAIDVAVEVLQEKGPGLGRPLVDTVAGSRHSNMKELRPGGSIRVLFAFDPRRTAILLIGGDKRHQWNAWYEEMIPVADQLFDDHLAELRQTGGTT